jgi:regulator of sigma E protease
MIITIIIFIVVLGLLVFVHEFGHFVASKRAGLRVDEFGFGFPPRAVGIVTNFKAEKWRDKLEFFFGQPRPGKVPEGKTIYSLNWIPLGGFVKIYGEGGEGKGDRKSFASQKPGRRAFILFSGVLMNVLLAAFLISVGFFLGLPQEITPQNEAYSSDVKIQIIDVAAGSPAQKAGLKRGDAILGISEKTSGDSLIPSKIEEVREFVKNHLGRELDLEIIRANEVLKLAALAREDYPPGEGPMGIAMARTGTISFPWYRSVWEGVKLTVYLLGQIIFAFYFVIKNLVASGQVVGELAGPVGIFIFTGEAARLGFIYLLQFTALISLNLAVINAFPFPALDGGRALFVLIEKMKGSPVNRKIEQWIHNIGFALLLALILLITIRDVGRFF